MFTGIIESLGIIEEVSQNGTNKTFWINSALSSGLTIDESLCHSGVCLTIEEIRNETHRVTAIRETLEKTNLKYWKKGDLVNLERSMKMNGRIDGHIVQGHVDGMGKCISKKDLNGSFEYTFKYDEKNATLLIEKGSVCVNGVSLTAFNVSHDTFTVAIIPYTLEHTNFKSLKEADHVNLEFDILGKYVSRILHFNKAK
jgi:riboflavin synthase